MTIIKHVVLTSRMGLLITLVIALIPAFSLINDARGFTQPGFPWSPPSPETNIYLPIAGGSTDVWQVASPDSHLRVTLVHAALAAPYADEKRLYYTVQRDGAPILEYSPLGITMDDMAGDFLDDLTFVDAQRQTIAETYTLITGKRSLVENRANELTLRFYNRESRPMELVVRVYDDGVGYRYRFPGDGAYRVVAEHSGFRLPEATVAWAQVWQNNYEREYYRRSLAELDEHTTDGWGYPILLNLPNGNWALLTEAAMNGNYAALHFNGSGGDRLLRFVFPPDQDGPISGTLPLETPWRVIMTGPSLATLVESDLVTNLSPPAQFADTTWIKPGRVAWSWWAHTRSPASYESQREHVDFAAEMGWEYVLVDEGWDADWVPELVQYAAQRNVGIILWSFAEIFDEETAQQWQAWGVKGAKLDFIDSDRQDAFRELYDPLYAITARHRLMLNFHGATKPSGEQRQWPHQLTREAVRGAEYRDLQSYENINLVFSRNIIGAMDYTPVVLSRPKGEWTTTYANQLALAVLFESGWQHFPDTPENYRASPGNAFLKTVPTTWDDTRLLAGHPDEFVVLARRNDAAWYIGVNGTDAGDVHIPLDFLDPTQTYTATIYKDGNTDTEITVDTRTVTAADTLSVYLRQNGGSALRIVPR